MFREFFCGHSVLTSGIAWVGLAAVVGYSIFLAHVKVQINDFYSRFYDLLQSDGGAVLEGSSGDVGSGVASNAQMRERVWEELQSFAWIVLPLITFSPAAKWLRSAWSLQWRLALMRAYLGAWDVDADAIEGASQRLHEDTQRFASAIQGCLVTVLDALFTLVMFLPILADLSVQIAPPVSFGAARCVWLVASALAAAIVGLGGAMCAGQKLVGLEVNNQKVEALLRKGLVLLESGVSALFGTEDGHGAPASMEEAPRFFPSVYFAATLVQLRENYYSLFLHFGLLNFWLAAWDQILILFPYVVAAPLLFADDPRDRITLGKLIKLSNSFEKCFAAFSVLSENWGAINEFRSVLRRLDEFESRLYYPSARTGGPHGDTPARGCLLPPASDDTPRSDDKVRHGSVELTRPPDSPSDDPRYDMAV